MRTLKPVIFNPAPAPVVSPEAEVVERYALMVVIEKHRGIFNACDSFSTDTGRDTDDDPEYVALSNEEYDLLWEVIEHPATTTGNIVLKGQYLAAVRSVGGLGYENAEGFVDTFLTFGADANAHGLEDGK